jgi:hypothetical protein
VLLPRPIRLLSASHVTLVACGGVHSLAATSANELWVWGSGADGRLGLGEEELDCQTHPRMMDRAWEAELTAAACGASHSLALLRSGAVYAWGLGESGQLGLGGTDSRSTPVVIGALSPVTVTSIAAGAHHSLATTASGEVYGWGRGSAAQLGMAEAEAVVLLPVCVQALKGVRCKLVAAGDSHSLALSAAGELYSWGSSDDGQSGHGTTDRACLPLRIRKLEGAPIGSVACGLVHTVGVRAFHHPTGEQLVALEEAVKGLTLKLRHAEAALDCERRAKDDALAALAQLEDVMRASAHADLAGSGGGMSAAAAGHFPVPAEEACGDAGAAAGCDGVGPARAAHSANADSEQAAAAHAHRASARQRSVGSQTDGAAVPGAGAVARSGPPRARTHPVSQGPLRSAVRAAAAAAGRTLKRNRIAVPVPPDARAYTHARARARIDAAPDRAAPRSWCSTPRASPPAAKRARTPTRTEQTSP